MNIAHLTILAITTAVVIAAEHFTFGRWWRGNEIARRTMGHATILLVAAFFVPSGLIDLETLIALTVSTGVAGAFIGVIHTHESETKKKREADRKREIIEAAEPGT